MSVQLTRRGFAASLAASAALPACATQAPQAAPPALPQSEELAAAVASVRATHNLPAFAVYVGRDGAALDCGIDGVRAIGAPERATLNDRWHIGSCTKAFTATLLARYVDRGLARWDQPISELLPDLAGAMHADARAITLAHLLTMRAGLPENPVYIENATIQQELAALEAIADAGATPSAQRTIAAERALAHAPVSAPGSAFAYSNTGYIIAGAIADRLGGIAYEDGVAREIMSPLGINDYGWGAPGRAGVIDQPRGHGDPQMGDVYRPVEPNERWADNPPFYASPGGLNTTLSEWAKFAYEHGRGDRGDGTLLAHDTYVRMHTPAGEGSVYAYGWGAGVRADGRRWVITHNGSNGLWFADIRVFPQTGIVYLLATNDGREEPSLAAFTEIRQHLNERFSPAGPE